MTDLFTGLIAATHTPLHPDGSLNLSVVETLAEHLMRNGVRTAFIAGTTGESLSLTIEERLSLTTRWCEVSQDSDLQIIVHVGAPSLSDSQRLARHALNSQADAIASMSPCFIKPASVSDLVVHCRQIAESAGDLPFYYYEIPPLTHLHFSMLQFVDEARDNIPTFAGLKYSHPDLMQLQELLALELGNDAILFGVDEVLLSAWALGVQGAVGSTYNFAAPLYHQIITAFEESDWKTAREQQRKSVRMIRRLASVGFLPASKFIMSLQGVPCGPVRSPLANLSEEEQRRLQRDWEELKIPFAEKTRSV